MPEQLGMQPDQRLELRALSNHWDLVPIGDTVRVIPQDRSENLLNKTMETHTELLRRLAKE